MKTILILTLILISALFATRSSEPTKVFPETTRTPILPPTQKVEQKYTTGDVLDEEALMLAYTRPIVIKTVLRSKPWESSKPNLGTELVPGDIVQVYPSPLGASKWVEVWVPRYRVTGYVLLETLGETR